MKEPEELDVFEEASRQQLPALKLLASGFVIYIGGQLLLGEEGTRNLGLWLKLGPLGPIWNVLSEPIIQPKDMVSLLNRPWPRRRCTR